MLGGYPGKGNQRLEIRQDGGGEDQWKKGELPKPKANLAAEGSILALQDAFSKVGDAAESYSDIVDASDFNLDEDDKEQGKKIEEARATLTDVLSDICEASKTYHTNLKAFNKHLKAETG
jgi:hypothetical protein